MTDVETRLAALERRAGTPASLLPINLVPPAGTFARHLYDREQARLLANKRQAEEEHRQRQAEPEEAERRRAAAWEANAPTREAARAELPIVEAVLAGLDTDLAILQAQRDEILQRRKDLKVEIRRYEA